MTVDLFTPFELGALQLPNRIVMAPMTRGRAGPGCVPGDPLVEHYRQRASAGLLITEATHISVQGRGWVGAPGIHTAEQVQGWQRVTSAVHEAGGRIFVQLWHMGRASHSDFHDGELSVSSTNVGLSGEISTPRGRKAYEAPRALELAELPGIVAQYANATRLAREAGFDGVEIHAANGYLIDQFLRNGCNDRGDAYGGSIENRSRLLFEIVEGCIAQWQADRVGVRFSPTSGFNGMSDSDPTALYSHVAAALNAYSLAYVHLLEALPGHVMAGPGARVAPEVRRLYKGPLIINGGYDLHSGNAALARGEADCIAFGLPYIANPDLVVRYRTSAPLNQVDPATMYTHGAEGYNDYPRLG